MSTATIEYTDIIRQKQEQIAAQQTDLATSIQDLKKSGITWCQIGSALGISSSAAHSRYGLTTGASTLTEAIATRRKRAQTRREAAKAGKLYDPAVHGYSAAEVARKLGVDSRTVASMGPTVRSKVRSRMVRMPTGRTAARFFPIE